MDLQPLYELKERLEHATIAGVGILSEDFRLKRAVDALAPLAAASPVFAKLHTGSTELLEAQADGRGAKLLDLLGLVDAVAYTQGVVGANGDLIPLETGVGSYVHASYGQLQPLITALSGIGGGRMGIIQEQRESHPEYFGDFRVPRHGDRHDCACGGDLPLRERGAGRADLHSFGKAHERAGAGL